jgi:hypothetical protein
VALTVPSRSTYSDAVARLRTVLPSDEVLARTDAAGKLEEERQRLALPLKAAARLGAHQLVHLPVGVVVVDDRIVEQRAALDDDVAGGEEHPERREHRHGRARMGECELARVEPTHQATGSSCMAVRRRLTT